MIQLDPRKQTHEEWLSDYEGEMTSAPINYARLPNESNDPNKIFHYIEHKTTCKNSVILIFESLDRQTIVIKYFNVSLQGKKNKYPAKIGGQFNPPKLGNFRKFWMSCTGKVPSRWCRVHKSLRSAFNGLQFTGNYEIAYDKERRPYNRFSEVVLYKKAPNKHV